MLSEHLEIVGAFKGLFATFMFIQKILSMKIIILLSVIQSTLLLQKESVCFRYVCMCSCAMGAISHIVLMWFFCVGYTVLQ